VLFFFFFWGGGGGGYSLSLPNLIFGCIQSIFVVKLVYFSLEINLPLTLHGFYGTIDIVGDVINNHWWYLMHPLSLFKSFSYILVFVPFQDLT